MRMWFRRESSICNLDPEKGLTNQQKITVQGGNGNEPNPKDAYSPSEIVPLQTFDWTTTQPLKLRPFKPKYHLTMGLTTITPSDLIQIDNTYLARIYHRRTLMQSHPHAILSANPQSTPAVAELYTYIFNTYLPFRYPTMFEFRGSLEHAQPMLLNMVTSETIPLDPPLDPVEALKMLGEHVDTDFLILLPQHEDGSEPKYTLQAFNTCFPSGFDTSEKLGMLLADIHGPVPGYRQKIEKSMDRFFARLEVGKFVRRCNWSITTHDRLFVPSGNHLYEGQEVLEDDYDFDINNTHLRCELQTLHRLPETHALVFAFKTYLYPLSEIKAEGLGDELATAIDGLKEGSVPEMHFYKKGVVWGERIKAFLRS